MGDVVHAVQEIRRPIWLEEGLHEPSGWIKLIFIGIEKIALRRLQYSLCQRGQSMRLQEIIMVKEHDPFARAVGNTRVCVACNSLVLPRES